MDSDALFFKREFRSSWRDHGVDDRQALTTGTGERVEDAPWILSLNALSAGRRPSIVRSITASMSGLYTSPDTSGGLL